MYLPQLFAESCPEQLHRIIREHPLGMLVTHTGTGLDANHLPFVLDPTRGPSGTLLAHVARANPIWKEVPNGERVLVVFRGVQGYISPNWYPSKHETHRHVPTWNYEIVHAHGRISVFDDEKFVRGMVAKLTRQSEANEPRPWKMRDAPADYLAGELSQIVGIVIELDRVEGKRKLSQNRDARDFEGTVGALDERGNSSLAAAMRRSRISTDESP
ncbi:PaiB family negative transcriptional regulator [Luteimonas cucumeris]|uniref:PaiB family negative transcriptional regulator n=1 Tax=Luteimonas cucumeris TaxID=985012 RepID=A0A562L219_9GAMM|nr:FMN-binding negative transcriptional regulator [Luteimonas cucumeris]TWI01673.1 PaiB family negative transcriptional regulator [Luteimonas cucumeris]